MSPDSPDDLREAVRVLTEAGYGVVSPSGHAWNKNIGLLPSGSMKISTDQRPLFGLVIHHEVAS